MAVTIDTREFNATLQRLKAETHRSGRSMVRYWARRLTVEMARQAPMAIGYKNSGRLRAGWWPAALELGASINTFSANRGEGSFIDQTNSEGILRFTIINAVPYIAAVAGIDAAMDTALERVMQRAQQELKEAMEQAKHNAGAA